MEPLRQVSQHCFSTCDNNNADVGTILQRAMLDLQLRTNNHSSQRMISMQYNWMKVCIAQGKYLNFLLQCCYMQPIKSAHFLKNGRCPASVLQPTYKG